MNLSTTLEAIQKISSHRQSAHSGLDLIARWMPGKGTQLNLSSRGGRSIERKHGSYNEGHCPWRYIRALEGVTCDPNSPGYERTWPLDLYAEAIGPPRCFQTRLSRVVGNRAGRGRPRGGTSLFGRSQVRGSTRGNVRSVRSFSHS